MKFVENGKYRLSEKKSLKYKTNYLSKFTMKEE